MSSSTLTSEVERTAAQAHGRSYAVTYVWLVLMTAFWGGNIVAGKEGLTGFGAMALSQLRLAGTAILFALLWLAQRGRPRLDLTARQWIAVSLVAFNGMTLNQICFIGGMARTSVAHTGLVVALGPVIVLAVSCLMRRERLTALKMLGMVISFSGVAVLMLFGVERGGVAAWQGDLIVLAGTVSFALYTIQLKEIVDQYDTYTLNTLTFGIGALLMIPFAARPMLQVRWSAVPLRAWMGLGFMIVFGSVVGYIIYAYALTCLSASRVATFAYLQPVAAVLLGVWILHERISAQVAGGGALILLGVYLAEREQDDRPRAV